MNTPKNNPSEFPQEDLQETPQERKERKWLEARLDAAVASGPAEEMTDEDWKELAAGAYTASKAAKSRHG